MSPGIRLVAPAAVERHGPADVAATFRTRRECDAILLPENTRPGRPNHIRAHSDPP